MTDSGDAEWDAALRAEASEMNRNWVFGVLVLCCVGLLGAVAGGFLVWLMVAGG